LFLRWLVQQGQTDMLENDRIRRILTVLRELYPDAICSLDSDGDPFHLLVSAILSAQCTDKRVNETTRKLFLEYPTAASIANESEEVIGQKIKSCGLYVSKAHALVESSKLLQKEFGGVVPSDIDSLTRFRGVGRKVANLIRGEVFSIPAIVVDTHCGRVSKRLGLTKSDNPSVIEKDLVACIPQAEWIKLGHRLVAQGRTLCMARNPLCSACGLQDLCSYNTSINYEERNE